MTTGNQRSAAARRGGRVSGAHALWVALLLVTLLAFGWQSFVTQTHRHFGERVVVAGLSVQSPGGTDARKSGQAPADSPDNCPICQEIAHGGVYLLPTPIALPVPAVLAAWFGVALLLALALQQRSHDWRSRAPPRFLQA
jgi:hypothetical protein